jgi:hypothetical protein
MRKIPQLGLVAAILLASALPASAASYGSLTVPVTISGIPAGWGVQITCNAGLGPAFSEGQIAVPLSGGAFSGKVVIVMSKNMAPGASAKCNLNLTQGASITLNNPPGYLGGPNAVTFVTATVNP